MKRIASIVTGLLAALTLGACTAPMPAEALRERGDRHFDRGEMAAAAADYEAITERFPGDWQAQYRLGLSRMNLGELSAARRALEIAHTRRPRDEAVSDALAEVMFQQGDEEQLFKFLVERTEVQPSLDSYLRLARFSIAANDPDSAKAAVETAMTLEDGQNVEPYLTAADLAEAMGDRDESIRRLRQAYWIDANDPRVSSRLRDLGEVPGPTIALPPSR